MGCSSKFLPCAASITGRARYDIVRCGQAVERNFPGAAVVYGDTDSLFISLNEHACSERMQWMYFESFVCCAPDAGPLPFSRATAADTVDSCSTCFGSRHPDGMPTSEEMSAGGFSTKLVVERVADDSQQSRNIPPLPTTSEVPQGKCFTCRKKIKRGLLENAFAVGSYMERYLNKKAKCPSGDGSPLIIKPSSIEMEKVMAPIMLVKAKNYFGLKYEGGGDRVRIIQSGVVMKKGTPHG